MTALQSLRYMAVLPTAQCNFACSYCYAAQARSSESLTPAQIDAGVEYFLSSRRTNLTGHTVTLIGGGEPLCRFDLCERTVLATERFASAYGRNVDLVLVTNGSLLDAAKCAFLVSHGVRVRFSFEILPDVQNGQRGMFAAVDNALRLFCSRGGCASVRTVLTPGSVGRLPEMAERLAADHPRVRELWCDIVTSAESFYRPEDVRDFGERFIDSYFAARARAAELGISLRNVMERQLTGGSCAARFCPGEFSLSPDGTISVCHRLSGRTACRAVSADYGRITRDGCVSVDEGALERILSRSEETAGCERCFLKTSCHGGCPMQNGIYSPAVRDAFCALRRRFSRMLLEKIRSEKHP